MFIVLYIFIYICIYIYIYLHIYIYIIYIYFFFGGGDPKNHRILSGGNGFKCFDFADQSICYSQEVHVAFFLVSGSCRVEVATNGPFPSCESIAALHAVEGWTC